MKKHKNHRTRTTIASKSMTMNLEKLGVSRFDFNDPYHLALTLNWPEFFVVVILADMAISEPASALFALLKTGVVAPASP